MKATYKLHHVRIDVSELPPSCIEQWRKYWEEYKSDYGSPESFDGLYGQNFPDIHTVKFDKIIVFSPGEIRAWFYTKDSRKAVHSFRFEEPRRGFENREFFKMWDSIQSEKEES